MPIEVGRVPVFTSLPPSMYRPDKAGRDIGPEYQLACIRSWIDAGFRPISVNGPDEQPPHQDLVEVIRAPRTAKELHGKPVVFIDDLFEIARSVTPGPVMIVNADILLRPTFDLAGMVSSLPENEARLAHRVDVNEPGSLDGPFCTMGFDIFIAHAVRLASVPVSDFAIGLPWWDYYVPMSLRTRGVNICTLTDRFASHLNHDGRWDQAQWLKFGKLYAERIVEDAAGLAIEADMRANGFQELVENCGRTLELTSSAVARDRLIAPLINSRSFLGIHLHRRNFKQTRKSLSRIAHQTVSVIGSFGSVRGNDV